MIYLLLSILCSTFIILVFKAFQRFNVNTFEAIVLNYIVCVITGIVTLGGEMTFAEQFWQQDWFPVSLILGFCFIGGFYTMSITVQKIGITVASVASKISLVLSVTASFFLYSELVNGWKIAGIILAVAAIYFTSRKKEDAASLHAPWFYFLLPFLVFTISGFIEILLKYSQVHYLADDEFAAFCIFLFGTAAAIGILIFLFNWLYYKLFHKHPADLPIPKDLAAPEKGIFQMKNILGGIILGIPNYGSIFFLIKTLDQPNWESSVVFPVNNIAIVTLSAIFAFIIFRERISRINFLGIIMAITAIVIIAIGSEGGFSPIFEIF